MRIPPRPLGESAFESAATLRAALDKIAAAADPAAAARATGPAVAPASGVQLRLELNYRSHQANLHLIHHELPLKIEPPSTLTRCASLSQAVLDAASALLAPSYALSPTEQLQLVAATEDVPTRDDGADHPVQAKRAPHSHERLGSGGTHLPNIAGGARVGPGGGGAIRRASDPADAIGGRGIAAVDRHPVPHQRAGAPCARLAEGSPTLPCAGGLTCADSSRRCPSSASCSARSSRTS